MARERVLHDGEAEAGAAGLARAAAIDAVEALRQPRDVLGSDADTGVLHRERRAFGPVAPEEAYFAALRGIAHGVGDEVAEGARELGFRAEDVDFGRAAQRDRVASAGQGLGVGVKPLEQRLHAHPLAGRRRRRFEHRERQQVLDDPVHARGLLLHHAEVVAGALRVELQLAHRLEETDQDRERRAQLVRDIGDEVAPHGLEALRLRDVAGEEQLLRCAVRNQLQGKQAVAADRHAHGAPLAVPAARQIIHERRCADEVGDRLAEIGARVQPELGGRRVVEPFDAVLGVQDHYAVGQRLRRAAKAHQRIGEQLLAPAAVALVAVQGGENAVPGAAALRHLAVDRAGEPAREQREVPEVVEQDGADAGGERGPAPGRAGEEPREDARGRGGGEAGEAAKKDVLQDLRNP